MAAGGDLPRADVEAVPAPASADSTPAAAARERDPAQLPAEADPRLRAFVHSIVAAGSVPRGQRDDVEEEMLGHLLERAAIERTRGAGDDEAVDRAVAAFGDSAALAAELQLAFHSRLWASTVGVLLARHELFERRPSVVSAMALLVGVAAAIDALLGFGAVVTFTPGRAIVTGVSAAVLTIVSVLAYQGVRLGQRWAFRVALAILVTYVVSGVVQVATAPEGTTVIPLGTIVAAVVLLWAIGENGALTKWFSASRPIGRALGLAVAAGFVAASGGVLAGPSLPDPTQATAADVDMTIAMECGARPFQVPDGPLVQNQRYATIDVRMPWRRGDVLPFGVRGLFGGSVGGDTAGFRILAIDPATSGAEPNEPGWFLLVTDPVIRVVETGEVAGWFGSTSPSQALIPDTIGSFTVGIENDRIAAGHTIQIAWTIGASSPSAVTFSPRAEVAYAHLDRFLLLGTVGCGERAAGGTGRVPAPQSEIVQPPGESQP